MKQLLLIIAMYAGCLYAQPAKYEFGKISDDEIFLSDYPPASDASALMLFDKGEVSIEWSPNYSKVVYLFHRRIKILREEGLSWAKVSIPYDRKFREEINNVRGATYNPLPNGEYEEIKLDKKVVAYEEIGNNKWQAKFPLPAVRVGSVIEYSYVLTSANLQVLRDWSFQHDIPVLYSEFSTYIPNRLTYIMLTQGDLDGLKVAAKAYSDFRNPNAFVNNEMRLPGLAQQSIDLSGQARIYSIENVFPAREEPYTTVLSDHVAKIGFALAKNLQYGRTRIYTWKDINNELWRSEGLGKLLQEEEVVAEGVKMGNSTKRPIEKIEEIFETVRNKITWDGNYSIYGERPLAEVLDRGKGNSAEINLVLLQLLIGAGIEAHPVLISTRDHGKVQPYQPETDQFNHLIVLAKIRNENIFLDALSREAPFDMLPRTNLNEIGLQLNRKAPEWVDIIPRHEVIRNTYTRFEMDPTGMINGELEVIFREYSAANERGKLQLYADKKDEYIRKEILAGLEDATVYNYTFSESTDPDDPLNIVCKIATRRYTQSPEGLLIVRPLLTQSILENPFKEEKRVSPINLPCPIREYYLFGLVVPAGYEIAQLPQPIRVLLPDKAGSFSYNVLVDGNIVHVSSTIFLEKTAFQPEEYESVRQFFQYIIRKYEEDLIFKKKEVDEG